MKNLIITSLSVLALAMAFTGCGESGSVASSTSAIDGGSGTGNGSSPVEKGALVIDNGDTGVTTITNEFGLNPTLGTPPPLPAS